MKLFFQFLPQDIWSSSQFIWLFSDSIWFFKWLIFTLEMLCLLANSTSKLFNFTWKDTINIGNHHLHCDWHGFCKLRICVGAVSNLLLSLEVIRKVDEWVCLPRQLGSPGPGPDLWKWFLFFWQNILKDKCIVTFIAVVHVNTERITRM